MDNPVIAQLQAVHQRGEYGRALYLCEQFLRNPAQTADRAAILWFKGSAHFNSGRAWWGEAVSSWREGLDAAGKNRQAKARIITSLSVIYTELGDCTACEQMIHEFERAARGQNGAVKRLGAYVWFNYGCALDNAFRWNEATEALQKALETARAFGVTHIHGQSLHNLGGVYLCLGNLDAARAAMAQAEAIMPDDTFGHKKLSRRAEYYLAVGDLHSTLHWITEALIHPGTDDMTRADVYYTWAQALAQLDHPHEAQEKALLSLDYAVKSVHYPGIHKTNALLQRFGPHRP